MATIVVSQDDIVGHWVCKEIGKLWIPDSGRAIGWIDDAGELIAGVTFTNFDGVNVWLDCAAKPGSKWLDRRGLWAVFNYCFEQLRCVRASALIPSNNNKSLKLVDSAGFEVEALLKRAAPEGHDMIVVRMFREDCRWLGEKTGL